MRFFKIYNDCKERIEKFSICIHYIYLSNGFVLKKYPSSE